LASRDHGQGFMTCSAQQSHHDGNAASRRSLAARIGVALLSRIVISISRRFAYPFAPALSRGLGVEITAITSLVALNQATALLALAIAPLSDKFGYRRMMLAGLCVLGLGMLCGGLAPAYTTVMLALFLAGLGKNMFDPANQGYVSDRVPLNRRGQIVGLLETSWALGTLLGLPLVGLLMQEAGWRAPFLAIGAMAVLCVGLAIWLVPRDKLSPSRSLVMSWGHWPSLLRRRAMLGILGYAFFTGMAMDSIFVVSGVWLEKDFHLNLAALGAGAAVIGVAELVGESLIAVIGDRLGLRRSMIAGTALSGPMPYGVKLRDNKYDENTQWPEDFDPKAHGGQYMETAKKPTLTKRPLDAK